MQIYQNHNTGVPVNPKYPKYLDTRLPRTYNATIYRINLRNNVKAQRMKKNILIIILAFTIIGLMCLLYIKQSPHSTTTVRFPDVKLGEKEHITQAMMQFQLASIKSIRNIPPNWYVTIDLDPPPNPTFRGNIEVGAAALSSTKELPEFELAGYASDEEPKAIKAILMVQEYPGDGKEREIEIDLNKPYSQKSSALNRIGNPDLQ
jgi:hypothetical protein